MILVSCSDGLQDCKVADDMLNIYPTPHHCEFQLAPAVRKISIRGEQIFGRCITADNNQMTASATVHWKVDAAGDFYVEIRNDENKNQPQPQQLPPPMLNVWLTWPKIPAA